MQAVLFDMDGTIVDTEPYWIAGEYELVESFGGAWNDHHSHQLVGNALTTSAAYIREHGRVPLPDLEIIHRLQNQVIARARQSMPWRPGAVTLLAALREQATPVALVTMSYADLAEVVVDALPADTFAAVVTGDQVLRGKPDPEPYLLAAERLGVDPRCCVAIEDSPTGAASAEAAGCVVVVVPHHVHVAITGDRVAVASLSELTPDGLQALLRRQRGWCP